MVDVGVIAAVAAASGPSSISRDPLVRIDVALARDRSEGVHPPAAGREQAGGGRRDRGAVVTGAEWAATSRAPLKAAADGAGPAARAGPRRRRRRRQPSVRRAGAQWRRMSRRPGRDDDEGPGLDLLDALEEGPGAPVGDGHQQLGDLSSSAHRASRAAHAGPWACWRTRRNRGAMVVERPQADPVLGEDQPTTAGSQTRRHKRRRRGRRRRSPSARRRAESAPHRSRLAVAGHRCPARGRVRRGCRPGRRRRARGRRANQRLPVAGILGQGALQTAAERDVAIAPRRTGVRPVHPERRQHPPAAFGRVRPTVETPKAGDRRHGRVTSRRRAPRAGACLATAGRLVAAKPLQL